MKTKKYVLYENHSVGIKMFVTTLLKGSKEFFYNSNVDKALKFNDISELLRFVTQHNESLEAQLQIGIVKKHVRWQCRGCIK